MGRWSWSNKTEADRLKKVEMWWLKKYGYLDGWKSGGIQWNNSWSEKNDSIGITVSTMDGENYIRFNYSQTEDDGEKKNFDYRASLVSSPCNYGGKRYWFLCPLSKNGVLCGRRVGVLYKSGDYFGCRHCYELTYKSKNENRQSKYRCLFKVFDMEEKLEKVEEGMKRHYYAGKPTRKYRRMIKILNQSQANYALLKNTKML